MRRLVMLIVALVILTLVPIASCAKSAPRPTPAPGPTSAPMPAPIRPQGPQGPQGPKGPTAEQPSVATAVLGQPWAVERMIVRTGSIYLKVESVAKAVDEVKDIAKSLGGYVVSSTWQGEGEGSRATICIRVPSESYDEAIRELRSLAVEVVSESTKTKDVTEEYVDLKSKLRNLEATEREYLTLLEKAETVEDVLKIQAELSKVRGEIETTKGRMQYLERTSATSLIEIHLEQVKPLKAQFKANRIEVREGERVVFTNESTGGFAPYGYRWDFGDGTSSTERDPTHVYREAKTYTVSLKISDAKGNVSIETKTDYIQVVAQPGWSAGNIAQSAWRGLTAVARGLGKLAIWLGVFSPVWIPLGMIIYLINRRRRKRTQ